MLYEIHITFDSDKIFDIGLELDIKTIGVNLLRPDRSIIRTEYMTSIAKEFDAYENCLFYVSDLMLRLSNIKANVIRTKIECPFYAKLVSRSIYIESHTKDNNPTKDLPISQNTNKVGTDNYLTTERCYERYLFESFYKHFMDRKDTIVELCLFDSNVLEDKDWFMEYKL